MIYAILLVFTRNKRNNMTNAGAQQKGYPLR
jgi:hypothetical protein